MLGSWYTPREIGKRAMIFWLAGSIGQMFSGFLQAAAYKNLNGVHGHEGWRWLFIIDGIITIPLAVMGYAFFPNLPQGGVKTWWTTQKEHELSISRLKAVGRAGKQPWTRAKAKRIALSWHTYVLRKCPDPSLKMLLTPPSYAVRHLEQCECTASNGFLVEEFQFKDPPSRARSYLFGS